MKTYIIGAGGVGAFLGALLAENGVDLHFVSRRQEEFSKNGLFLRSVFAGDIKIDNPNVIGSISEIENPELIFVAVKTYHLKSISKELKKVINKNTIVITLQNGIEADKVLLEEISDIKVYPGLVYIISNKTAPGVVEQIAGPCLFSFGARDKRKTDALIAVEKLLVDAGVKARLSNDIEKDLWMKFIWITTFAGMTCFYRSAIGKIVNNEQAFKTYLLALDQAVAVARACKIDIAEEKVQKIIKKSEDYRKTGTESKSSMLLDLEAGRETEIEALTGTLVRLGDELGVDVSIHRALYSQIKLGLV